MILIDNFSQVVAQIETERGIKREEIIEAIEQALVSACRRRYNEEANLRASINSLTGETYIYLSKRVVKNVEDDMLEISLADAKKVNKDAQLEEDLEQDVTPNDFGRLAAQTAKQVIVHRIREAEKSAVLSEFKDKVGQIIHGTVQKIEGSNYLIDLGSVEAILTPRDQIASESFQLNERIRVYVSDVELTSRGPRIRISRSHPGMIRSLFKLEVPEIEEGILEIVEVSREAGLRSKVAVKSNDSNVPAVGTCVGHLGGRIQSIIKELGQEKIDILEWHEDPKVFIQSSLKPAKISEVNILNEDEKLVEVIVDSDQLSLAIGKQGSNVRLAVRLTGWRIEIKPKEEQIQPGLSLEEKIKMDLESQKAPASENSPEEVSEETAVSEAETVEAEQNNVLSDQEDSSKL